MKLADIQADALKISFLGGNLHHTAHHAARQANVRPPAQPVERTGLPYALSGIHSQMALQFFRSHHAKFMY
jgi:hypothetical protein